MGVLSGKGVELILRAGAHPGVGRHPQLSIPDWGAGRDGDHPGRAVQCQGTTSFLLFVHEIASLYLLSATHNTSTSAKYPYPNATKIREKI